MRLFIATILLTTLFNFNNSLAAESYLLTSTSIIQDASSTNESELVEAIESDTSAITSNKKKKIIPGLIYYLMGGFVALVIILILVLRKKPKK